MKTKSLIKNKTTKSDFITYGIVIVAFAVTQILTSTGNLSSLLQGLLVPICYNVILAVSLNITVGILGELSLGQAGFMCVGAYTSAIFSVCTMESIASVWIRFPLAILVGGVCAAVCGFLIGIPVLRLKGDYLAIVTLAFGEIIKNLCSAIYVGYDETGVHFSLTSTSELGLSSTGKVLINGPLGISGMPKNSTFIIGIVLVIITLFVTINLVRSRTGRAVMSIRDNRIAAESVGINITKYKLIAFTISAFLAGIGGVLYSHNFSILAATSKNFGYNMSIMFLVFVVLGGIGNIRGSVIAAVILTVLPEVLRPLAKYRMLIYAVVLIALMVFNSSPKFKVYREKYSIKKFISRKKEQKEPKRQGAE